MHVKRNALARGNVQAIDAGTLGLVDHVDRTEGLVLDLELAPRGRALDLERRNREPPKRAGLGETDDDGVDLGAALVGRWRR